MDQATKLAITRTQLAADRTLMSWIRTSLALIGFGFTIIKFFEYLRFAQDIKIKTALSGITHLGIFLIVLGTFSLIPAVIEYRREIKSLTAFDGISRTSYVLVVAFCVGILGLYTLLNALLFIFR